jgi:hypothetical protein
MYRAPVFRLEAASATRSGDTRTSASRIAETVSEGRFIGSLSILSVPYEEVA